MGKAKDLNIKYRTYYCFYYIIIDIRKFESNVSKIDKKLHKDFDIQYIGYDKIKKFGDCKNIRNVNPLYLIFHSATGYFEEKNGGKYLIFNSNKKCEEVISKINSEIKTINGGKQLFYEKDYSRTGVSSVDDDNVPLN